MKHFMCLLAIVLTVCSCTNFQTEPKDPLSFMGITLGDSITCLDSLKDNPNITSLEIIDSKDVKVKESYEFYGTDREKEIASFNTVILSLDSQLIDVKAKILTYNDRISKIIVEPSDIDDDKDYPLISDLYQKKYGMYKTLREDDILDFSHNIYTYRYNQQYIFWEGGNNGRIYLYKYETSDTFGRITLTSTDIQIIYADMNVIKAKLDEEAAERDRKKKEEEYMDSLRKVHNAQRATGQDI